MSGFGYIDKESDFPEHEPGEYVVRFKEWKHPDMYGLPVLQPVDWPSGMVLLARYGTELEDGEEGPPGSLDPLTELALFVRAFGGDPSGIPAGLEYDDAPKLLAELEPTLTGTTKVAVTEKSAPWIKFVEGMALPEDESYLVKYGEITSKNSSGMPSWVPSERYEDNFIVWGNLRVVSGDYKGARMRFLLEYPFEFDPERLKPCFVRNAGGPKAGELRAASRRWKNFMDVFGVPADEFDTSKLDDVHNICPELERELKKANQVALVEIKTGKNRADMDRLTRIPKGMSLPDDVEAEAEQAELPPFEPPKVDEDLTKARAFLRQAITQEARTFHKNDKLTAWQADDANDFALTDEGKAWAKEVLVPIVDDAGMGRAFAEYSYGELLYLLRRLGYEQFADNLESQGDF